MGGRVRGFGGVDGQAETGFGDHVDAFVGQFEVTNDRVVELFDASAVQADVVRTPAVAEFLTPRG